MAVRHLQRRRSRKTTEVFSEGISDRLGISDGALSDRNVAYLVALGPSGRDGERRHCRYRGRRRTWPWAGKFVAIAIMISTFSATNSVVLTAPRVFYAMANDNLFFKKLAEVHPRFQTPAAAIVALGVWSAVLTCAGKFADLASGAIFIGWIFYGLGAAAIFPIRRASKGLPIPYRVPGYPWTPLIFVLVAAAIVGNAIFLAFSDPQQFRYLAVAIVIFAAGASRLFFWRKNRLAPKTLRYIRLNGSISTRTAVSGISLASQ